MQKSGGCVQRCGCVKSSPPSDPGRYPVTPVSHAKDSHEHATSVSVQLAVDDLVHDHDLPVAGMGCSRPRESRSFRSHCRLLDVVNHPLELPITDAVC